MTGLDISAVVGATPTPPRRQLSITRVLRSVPMVIAFAFLGALSVVAIFAPVLAPYDPFANGIPLTPPGAEHLLGTDSLGRDVLSIMIFGTQVSLLFAVGAATISLVVGTVVGAIPTYIGGWLDDVSSRLVELVLMIPQLFLVILIVALLGQNLGFVILVVGLTIWPANARLMRAQVLSLKSMKFVDAAVISGRPPMWILFRHIVPGGMGPVIANSTLQMSAAVLTEAGLAFLGLGDPNRASWGQVLNDAQQYMTIAPWLALVPGIALFLMLLCLHVIGDGVGRILNPRNAMAVA